jgi:hypothetical protein
MRHGEGLLQVDILAREHRRKRELCMLVIGRADDDGIDVGTSQELPVVAVGVDLRRRAFRIPI